MKVQELVNLINAETDELLDTDEDHIPYINHALDVLAYTLAGTYAPDLLRSIETGIRWALSGRRSIRRTAVT